MTRPGSALGLLVALSLGGGVGGGLGCGKKASGPSGAPPELTGLAVVPATAEVVVGADVAKLADSPVIDRQVEQLMAREPTLAERWRGLRDDCKIELGKHIKRVMLALGPHAGPAPGTGPVLMIAVGAIPEADLKTCVTKLVGSGGGAVTGKAVNGRTVYLAKDGNHAMYFAYSRPDTVVLSADEAYLVEALGNGKKASDNPDLTAWRRLINENSPLWAAGRVDTRIRDGLVQLTEGKISAGPVAFALSADLSDGMSLQFNAVMTNPAQAKELESYVKGLMALVTAAAQLKSLGPVVGKVSVASDAGVVKLRAALTVEDLNLLLSALDGESPPAQDRAPPHPGAGSGAPK